MKIIVLIGLILFAISILFFYVKLKYVRHKLHWVVLILLAIFLYVTFVASIAGHNVDLTSLNGLEEAGGLYWDWLGNAFGNVKSLTTHAIKLDWNINNPFSK
jgi:glucan phosphoethanolaminetransferase (alkaline phosphatase superfamily)